MNNKIEIINNVILLSNLLEKTGNKFIFKKHNLTIKTYTILALIESGINKNNELAKYVKDSKSGITQKLKKLEENNFITRQINKIDKRFYNFELTKKSLEILEKTNKTYSDEIEILFKDFNVDQLKELNISINKIINIITKSL